MKTFVGAIMVVTIIGMVGLFEGMSFLFLKQYWPVLLIAVCAIVYLTYRWTTREPNNKPVWPPDHMAKWR